MRQLQSNPLSAATEAVDDVVLGRALVASMYDRASWPGLDVALSAALEGDGSGLADIFDAFVHPASGGGDVVEAMVWMNCIDDPNAAVTSDVAREQAPLLGHVWGLPDVCARTSIERGDGRWPLIDVPTGVVVAVSGDPASPAEGSLGLLRIDSDASGVALKDDGHLGYGRSSCVIEAVDRYLFDPATPRPELADCAQ